MEAMENDYAVITSEKVSADSIDSLNYMIYEFVPRLPMESGEEMNLHDVVEDDIDISADILQGIKTQRVWDLIQNLIAALKMRGTQNLVFPKLEIAEKSDNFFEIDWIFNYFRVYFCFDSQNGDSYGMVEADYENKIFSTSFKPMLTSKYNEIADEVVDFVINRMQR